MRSYQQFGRTKFKATRLLERIEPPMILRAALRLPVPTCRLFGGVNLALWPTPLTMPSILKPDPLDGGFNVNIPAYPHAHTQGDDVEDALRNAREVIELEIEVMSERGETLPVADGDADVRIERVAITPTAA